MLLILYVKYFYNRLRFKVVIDTQVVESHFFHHSNVGKKLTKRVLIVFQLIVRLYGQLKH